MIKPEELRIGNILKSHLTGEIVVTDWLVIKHVCDGNLQSIYDIRPVYEPIPLTEELLVKAGFKKVINDGSFENITLDYWAKDALLLFTNGSEPKEAYLVGHGNGYFGKYFVATGRWISHLHDLQNVYHAWKGTELTIKL